MSLSLVKILPCMTSQSLQQPSLSDPILSSPPSLSPNASSSSILDTLAWITYGKSKLSYRIFPTKLPKGFYCSIVKSLDLKLLDVILPHAGAISKVLLEKQRKIHIRFRTAFFYFFLFLGFSESPRFIYTLWSTIPVGTGLGSGASVCVWLSAALHINQKYNWGTRLTDLDLWEYTYQAFWSETSGTPSMNPDQLSEDRDERLCFLRSFESICEDAVCGRVCKLLSAKKIKK